MRQPVGSHAEEFPHADCVIHFAEVRSEGEQENSDRGVIVDHSPAPVVEPALIHDAVEARQQQLFGRYIQFTIPPKTVLEYASL